MKINLTELRPVELGDRALFDKHLAVMKSQSCECNFANIFAYRSQYQLQFLDAGDRLVVYDGSGRCIHYPIGKWTTPKELRAVCDAFRDAGLTDGGVYDVPEEFIDRYDDCDSLFELEYDEGMIDYLYSVDKIAGFVGPKLRKKHNLVKQFQSAFPYAEVCRINAENIGTVAEFAKDFNDRLPQCPFLDEENIAMEQAWKNFDELGLAGLVLFAKPDFPVGFSVYKILPSDTADIMFEKGDHTVKGAPQTLTWQLSLALQGKVRFINREQDMNEEGLRTAKRSLDPERFFKRLYLRAL